MGKTTKPLTIFVHPSILNWPEWQLLRDQGHVIGSLIDIKQASLDDPDLWFGPTCWRMDNNLRKYIDDAITVAREVKYPKVPKDAKPKAD